MVDRLTQTYFGSTNSSDGPIAGSAPFGEKLTETIGAVRFLVATSEAFAGQALLTVRTCEAFTMPRFVLVGNASASDNLE